MYNAMKAYNFKHRANSPFHPSNIKKFLEATEPKKVQKNKK